MNIPYDKYGLCSGLYQQYYSTHCPIANSKCVLFALHDRRKGIHGEIFSDSISLFFIAEVKAFSEQRFFEIHHRLASSHPDINKTSNKKLPSKNCIKTNCTVETNTTPTRSGCSQDSCGSNWIIRIRVRQQLIMHSALIEAPMAMLPMNPYSIVSTSYGSARL